MLLANLKLVDEYHPNNQRVAILREPFKMDLGFAEIPEPNEGEIRIKIAFVGICGSDLECYRGNRHPEFLSFPNRLGHEVGGIVDKVGKNISSIKKGDKVTCRYVWGAFAEYIVCEPFNVKVVPDYFPIKETSLLEVLPGIMHAAELSDIKPNSNVLIMGQGVSGLIMTQVTKLFSPKNLVVTDLHDHKLSLAKKYGGTHTYKIKNEKTSNFEVLKQDFPDGFDIVIPCLLDGEGMIDALDCAAFCGKIVMYGCIGICNEPFDFFKVHRKRLSILSTEPRSDIDMRRFYQEAVQLVLDGLINTKEMITHIYPLSQIQEAFELRNDKSDDKSIHVLIQCT